MPAPEHISRSEIRKDAVQGAVEAAATTVGQVATIVTGAVRDVAKAVGGLGTELFEIRDAARRAELDGHGDPVDDVVGDPLVEAETDPDSD